METVLLASIALITWPLTGWLVVSMLRTSDEPLARRVLSWLD